MTDDATSNGRLAAALDLAERRGWELFPVGTRDGRDVPPEGWPEKATRDPRRLRRLWQRYPNPNPAVRCGPGSGVLVVDVDPRHGGDESLAKLEEDLGPLPGTLTARTGGGGRHLYFRWVDLDRAARDNFRPGVDVKAGTDEKGAFAYAPPTRRAKHGGRPYEWEDPDAPIAALPEAWVEALRAADDGDDERFRLPKRIPEGTRNDTLYRYGCQLRAQGADRRTILARLREASETRCEPPLPEGELETLADQAADHERGTSVGRLVRVEGIPVRWRLAVGGRWLELSTRELHDLRRVQERASEEAGVLPVPTLGWKAWKAKVSALMAEAEVARAGDRPEPRPYHPDELEDLAPEARLTPFLAYEGRVNLLHSREKVGKTTLVAADLALANEEGIKAFWATEMSGPLSRAYLLRAGLADPDLVRLALLRDDPPRSWEELEDWLEDFRPDVVYVDTLATIVPLLEPETPKHSEGERWQGIMSRFGRWSTDHARSVVVTAHDLKSGDGYRGSTGIGAGTDLLSSLTVRNPEGDPYRDLRTTGRGAPSEDRHRILRYDEATGRYEPVDERELRRSAPNAGGREDVDLAVLKYVHANEGCTTRALREGVDRRAEELTEARDILEAEGLIENRGPGRAHAWYPTTGWEEALRHLESDESF